LEFPTLVALGSCNAGGVGPVGWCETALGGAWQINHLTDASHAMFQPAHFGMLLHNTIAEYNTHDANGVSDVWVLGFSEGQIL
jgi:hypothetical protein